MITTQETKVFSLKIEDRKHHIPFRKEGRLLLDLLKVKVPVETIEDVANELLEYVFDLRMEIINQ